MDYSVGEDFYLRGKKNEIVEHSGKLLTSSDLTLKSPVPRVLTRHKSPLNRRHRRFTEGLSGRWLAPPAAPKLGGGGAPTPAEVAAKAAEVAESAGRHPQLLSGGRQKWHRGDDLLPTAGDRWFLGGRGPHLCDEEPFGWPADASGRVWLDRPDSVRHQHAVLHCLSPSSVTTEAARHHLDGVRFDESLLMDAQRQLELERTGPPRDKWYTLKSPLFSLEARRHNRLLAAGLADANFGADFRRYRRDLLDQSEDFRRALIGRHPAGIY
ncbi:hypothetical protein BOX15_Mlig009959g1 [Macrostomum lignano]|nr:hypothetical protein BOX15_Mlig009959g1 [Macrostomum lignano]